MRQRSRTRSIVGVTTLATDTGGTPTVVYSPRSSSLVIDDITDVSPGFGSFNYCRQDRLGMDDAGASLPRAKHVSANSYYAVSIGSIFAHYHPISEPDGFPIPDFGLGELPYYTDAMNELMRDALGAMPTSVNMVVNAAEFASVKTLIPQIIKIGRNLIRNKLGKKSLKELANGHLLHSFGIKPLISDISSFLDIRSAVAKRIKQLENRNSHKVRLVKRTGYRKLSLPYSGTFSSLPNHLFSYNGSVECSVSGTVSADCTAFYNTASPESQCKLWSSALGLTTPLQSIWELIPFSFVFDWFVPIGDTLRRVEDKLGLSETAMNYSLDNFGWSKTVESTACAKWVVSSSNYPSWNGRAGNCPTFRATRYERQAGIPHDGQLIPPVGWSLSKTALSISLIAQKVLK